MPALLPTLLEMLGLRPWPGQTFDGVCLEPAMRGGSLKRDASFCYFPHTNKVPDPLPPSVCVRQGDWKLIRVFHDSGQGRHRYELYNLKEDTGEKHNRAGREPERVEALDALIERFLANTKAVVPVPNPAYRPPAKP